MEARLWQSQALQEQRESLEQVVAELEQQKVKANAAVARHWELKQQTKLSSEHVNVGLRSQLSQTHRVGFTE